MTKESNMDNIQLPSVTILDIPPDSVHDVYCKWMDSIDVSAEGYQERFQAILDKASDAKEPTSVLQHKLRMKEFMVILDKRIKDIKPEAKVTVVDAADFQSVAEANKDAIEKIPKLLTDIRKVTDNSESFADAKEESLKIFAAYINSLKDWKGIKRESMTLEDSGFVTMYKEVFNIDSEIADLYITALSRLTGIFGDESEKGQRFLRVLNKIGGSSAIWSQTVQNPRAIMNLALTSFKSIASKA